MKRISTFGLLASFLLSCGGSEEGTGPGSSRNGNGGGTGTNAGSGNVATGVDEEDDLGIVPPEVSEPTEVLEGTIENDVGPEITVAGAVEEVTFTVRAPGGAIISDDLVWLVDDTAIGSIGNDGVFRANGFVGGVVTVTARVGNSAVETTFTVNVDITDNPGNVSADDQSLLVAGGVDDAEFRWLYPYDGTVFPRGIVAPTLQLGGGGAITTYLKITAPYFSYQQFANATTPAGMTLPAEVWRGLTLTSDGSEDVTVSASKLAGGAVTGPVTAAWRIAPASIKGIIYYNTYNTFLSDVAEDKGAIMRIRPGQDAEILQSGCTVCHTVSAKGNVLATAQGFWGDGVGPGAWDNAVPTDSVTYDLSEEGEAVQRNLSSEGRLYSFAALSPNGEIALVSGIPDGVAPPFVPRAILATGGFRSRLVNTSTGEVITSPSLARAVGYAQTPVFAPDGTRVAFINGDRLPAARVLSVMEFNGDVTAPVFEDPVDLVTETTDTLAWPSFLPDGKAIVYHQGDSFDSSGFIIDANAPSEPRYAELRMVNVDTGEVNPLNAINGRLPSGEVYLPYGEAAEGRMNYEASVLPIAVGGYYWVLFTSRRAYGNTISPDGTIVGGDNPWGTEANPSPRKKIWIAALDIDHTSADPSHPAFYLPGQELESGNMRAFAALAPCRQDGSGCETGADCCGGFCRETSRNDDGTPVLECVPPPENECSGFDEACLSVEDCCDPRAECINGFCAMPTPIR
jgi:hypothetical protein